MYTTCVVHNMSPLIKHYRFIAAVLADASLGSAGHRAGHWTVDQRASHFHHVLP